MTATLTPTPGGAAWCVDDVDLRELLDSPAGLSGRELGERLVELDRVRRALEAATVAVLDEAERSDAYRDDGCTTLSKRWEQLADVDGAHQDAKTAHDGRRASLNRVDDTFHLGGQFGVIQGTAMDKILDAFVEAEWQADWDDVKARYGDDAKPNMVTRSQAQRRADALFAIFQAAVSGDGRTISDPLVHLVCDLATFEEHLARTMGGHVPQADPVANDTDVDADSGDPLDVAMGTGFAMRRCETIDGDPVDPSEVITATLIGHVRIVVVDRRGVVVNAGRKTRLFRGVARELVWLLGKTCCWRGCGHRLDVQVDHLDEYVRDNGPTDQANAGPLHGRHNRFKASHGYTITRDDHGVLHTWRPDGTELKPR
jgi:hypothetical protein